MNSLNVVFRLGALFAALMLSSFASLSTIDRDGQERWKLWRADLDYLYETIEEPSTLKGIFKDKGIEWKKIKKQADARFAKLASAAKKRRKDAPIADAAEFYGVLESVIGQLRDTHARLSVDGAIREAWQETRPAALEAGIALLPGSSGLILVASTYAARGANSPLAAKGVNHSQTYLESVNGVPAGEYFDQHATNIFEERGWQSSWNRAYIEALNDLAMGEGETLKLVSKTLKVSDAVRKRYLASTGKKRAKEFKRLKWKSRTVSLRSTECTKSRNSRGFSFSGIEWIELSPTSDKKIGYTTLASGLGYVRYSGVSGASRAAIEQACEALADCPGLVLDMRHNGGGGESGIGAFHNKEGSWNKPLAVLIGPKAMSAAETELWVLLQMRKAHECQARLFGRTTAGSSGAKVQFKLPSGFASGQFVVRHWHGGRSKIEGQGIEPDETVDQDIVELSVGIDSCLARAESWLNSQK